MNILNPAQIRELEKIVIAKERISSLTLMEWAAESISSHMHLERGESSVTIVCGKGNNGGDGLAIARICAEDGDKVKVIIIDHKDSPSPNFVANLKRLPKKNIKVKEVKEVPTIDPDSLIIDAMIGIGLSRPLTGLLADVVKYINTLPNRVISIDIPTGLFCENNTANDPETIIRADKTVTVFRTKLSFLFPENTPFIGELAIEQNGTWEEVPGTMERKAGLHSEQMLVDRDFVHPLIRPRDKFSHKGTYGHALLVAGAYGRMGAAVLAAKACMRSGAGLLTAHVPHTGVDIMQISIPEAMCSIDAQSIITELPKLEAFSAIGVGPGIGQHFETANTLKHLIQNCAVPLVLDADALNILSENKTWLSFLPQGTILTPHPKEFDRLAGPSASGYERWQKQLEFAKRYNCVVVLKGANTSTCNPAGQTFFNTTGNPGMATAGSGDVLTGIILGLLAQGYAPTEAAILGVYIHGLSGDLFTSKNGQESLIARDIIAGLGKAFKQLVY